MLNLVKDSPFFLLFFLLFSFQLANSSHSPCLPQTYPFLWQYMTASPIMTTRTEALSSLKVYSIISFLGVTKPGHVLRRSGDKGDVSPDICPTSLAASTSVPNLVVTAPSCSDPSPAGHQNCLMGSKLFTADHDDDISQDVAAPEAIKVEKNVTGMAGELDTAVSRRGHFVFT